MISKTLPCLLIAAAVSLAASTAAYAGQVQYVGTHPIPKTHAAEFCLISVPHVHVYEPDERDTLYRVHGDGYIFIGDPVAHGYDGPRYAFKGHHPLEVHVDQEPVGLWCYITGPHFHVEAPGVNFELRGEINVYTGRFPRAYKLGKKRYAAIDLYYEPLVYTRPVVIVAPAVEVHAPRVSSVVAAEADVHVAAPVFRAGVELHVPTIEIGVGAPAVYVEHDHHHHDRRYYKVKKRKKGRGHRMKFKHHGKH